MEDVTTKLGDSTLPTSPVEGGSWTAASAGSAVMQACRKVARPRSSRMARGLDDSPLANVDFDRVGLRGRAHRAGGATRRAASPSPTRCGAGGVDKIEADGLGRPDSS